MTQLELIKSLRNVDISQDSTANNYKFHLSDDYARINIAPDVLDYEKIQLFLNKIPVIVRNIIDEQYQSNDQQDKVNFDITSEIIKSAFLGTLQRNSTANVPSQTSAPFCLFIRNNTGEYERQACN